MNVRKLKDTKFALEQLVLGAEVHGFRSAPRSQLIAMLELAASEIAEAREGEDGAVASMVPPPLHVEVDHGTARIGRGSSVEAAQKNVR